MNECNPTDAAHNKDDCDKHATCTNIFGNFACKCNPGWIGDGKNCTNIDECAADNLNQCDAETTTCYDNKMDLVKTLLVVESTQFSNSERFN